MCDNYIIKMSQLQITDYLKNYSGPNKAMPYSAQEVDVLRNKLYNEQNILMKVYEDKGLILLYHKYGTECKTQLQRETRSIIIDRDTFNVVAFTGEEPYLNKEGLNFLLCSYHDDSKTISTESFEGTMISFYYHQNTWKTSTRRCIDSKESKFNSECSHYDLAMEVLAQDGDDFTSFTNKLDKECSYYFVLVHHKTQNVIDYTSRFGQDYKKLCLACTRDKDMNYIKWGDEKNPKFITNNVIEPIKMTSDEFDKLNATTEYDTKPTTEGIILTLFTMHGTVQFVKLQTTNYQFNSVTKPEDNMLVGLIHLYQNDKLFDYFVNNKSDLNRIKNPYTGEVYDIIGTIDAVFKVCSTELFELFKLLWDIKTGKHINMTLYDILPKEYKDILYKIRGIYYKKKAQRIQMKQDELTPEQYYTASHLKVTDIYCLLKTLNTNVIHAFIRLRKLMQNQVRVSSDNYLYKQFESISYKCTKMHLKLSAIFTSKLYPSITHTDVIVN